MSDLVELVEGEIARNEQGKFLYVSRKLSDVPKNHPEFKPIVDYIDRNLPSVYSGGITKLFGDVHLRLKNELVFFDIETCGLDGIDPINTISMTRVNGDVCIDNAFAMDYTQEAAIIKFGLDRILPEQMTLISYNGDSFDLDRLNTRALANGVIDFRRQKDNLQMQLIDMPKPNSREENEKKTNYIASILNGRHHDLIRYTELYFERMRKKHRGITLQELESSLFHVHRRGDIKSSQIPRVYHEFIYEGDNETEVAKIIEHNILDTVSLVALLVYFVKERHN